jgi:hypothetical protein
MRPTPAAHPWCCCSPHLACVRRNDYEGRARERMGGKPTDSWMQRLPHLLVQPNKRTFYSAWLIWSSETNTSSCTMKDRLKLATASLGGRGGQEHPPNTGPMTPPPHTQPIPMSISERPRPSWHISRLIKSSHTYLLTKKSKLFSR